MAKTFDCEPYLRALEEQSDSIEGAANGMLQAMETFKENAASVLRSVDNLKKMIGMTRRAMNFARGGRVVERVEVKREYPSLTPIEEIGVIGRLTITCLKQKTGIRKQTSPPIQLKAGILRFLPTEP